MDEALAGRGRGAAEAGGGGFFAGPLRLAGHERAELVSCLEVLDGRLEEAGPPGAPGWGWQAAAVLDPETTVLPGARARWLDLVAGLLEAADGARAGGRLLEGFALEGVAGRLLGTLLGDGGPGEAPEGPPGVGRGRPPGGH